MLAKTPGLRNARLTCAIFILVLAASSCTPSTPGRTPLSAPTVVETTRPPLNPESVVDHFLCYKVSPNRFAGPNLALIDQFHYSPPAQTGVGARRLLCNPVAKYRDEEPQRPIMHYASHLVCYEITRRAQTGRYVVSNQFTHHKFQLLGLRNSNFLCVPSGKSKTTDRVPQIPRDLDHYKCYDVEPTVARVARAHLIDQWIDRQAQVTLAPEQLCDPAEKVINGEQQGPMLHNFVHLICYNVRFSGPPFAKRTVRITNQFEPRGAIITAEMEQWLCVPSLKRKP